MNLVQLRKNLKFNMFISALKGLLSVLFPIITFPYISRVLLVDNVGIYNFSNSIISYFSLIAQLGVVTYATREGAKVRSNRASLENFCSEIFTLNLITTAIAYVLLSLLLIASEKANRYLLIILILSLQMITTCLGREYICTIFEDYFILTIRYLIFQIVSLVLLFIFVKSEKDLIRYVIVVSIATNGANIWNFFYTRKYVPIKLVHIKETLKHLKPILVFFATSMAVTIYASSDITVIGYMLTEHDVGIYSVSTKIYVMLKNILAAGIAVALPRLSAINGADGKKINEDYLITVKEIRDSVFFVGLPMVAGVCILSKPIILCFCGENYIEAETSLRLLSLALLLCISGYCWCNCVLYVFNKEKFILYVTVFCALLNVVLNIILIPQYGINAAAVTTILSELLSAMAFRLAGRRIVATKESLKNIIKIIVGIAAFIPICVLLPQCTQSILEDLLIRVFLSVVLYLLVEIILKHESLSNIKNLIPVRK